MPLEITKNYKKKNNPSIKLINKKNKKNYFI